MITQFTHIHSLQFKMLLVLLTFNQGFIFAQYDEGNLKSIQKAWETLDIADRYHAGLSIYDLQRKKSVFNVNAGHFFTPASNIKLLTMYAALFLLENQIDAAYYIIEKDSIYIWGGGDPGSYYPDINVPGTLAEFISSTEKQVVFADNHFQSLRYGKGWAWDDHAYSYQCERNAFPVYGNRMWIYRSADRIAITPSYLSSLVKVTKDTLTTAGRSEWGDQYFYRYDQELQEEHREIPITFFKNDLQHTWSEATGKEIYFSNRIRPPDAIPLLGSLRDTLIKQMMQESDNFIAEQLLQNCSVSALHYMSDEAIIDSLLRGPLKDLANEIEWVDGSGLSRYNRMTPASAIALLLKLLSVTSLDYLTYVLPAGGKSGTLEQVFKTKNGKTYLFAKSGSLSNTYCLSGLLYTRSGKILLFSWMNNQYPTDSLPVKRSMEKLFSFLYDQY